MTIMGRLRSRKMVLVSGLQPAVESESACLEPRPFWNQLRARLYDNQDGGSAVETALVTFFLVMPVLIGIFSVAMALITYQQLGYNTLSAARMVGNGRGLITDPCAQAATTMTTALPGLPSGNFTYTMLITQTVSGSTSIKKFGPTTGSGFSCSGTASGTGGYALTNAQGNTVSLQVSYAYNWFPIFGKKIAGKLSVEQTSFVN